MGILDANPGMQPAAGAIPPNRRRISLAAATSVGAHALALALLLWHPALFVHPRLVAHGEGGSAMPLATTLYSPRSAPSAPPAQPSRLSVLRAAKPAKRERSNVLENERAVDEAEAGSRQGSVFAGPEEGDEVKPAIPLPGSFADPKISRWELPAGLQGEVVVEITIDDQGMVVDERLLQGVGHGIDERVIAALRDWRFRPATRNGVAIPSKHDVHFHFPS